MQPLITCSNISLCSTLWFRRSNVIIWNASVLRHSCTWYIHSGMWYVLRIVWSERTPACSDEAFLYVNVTLSADNALLAWSRGSAVINQLNNTCTVTNTGRTFTKFVSSSNITSKMVETFVNGRIAVEGLDCLSGGDF